jgi:hypothetical protein
MNTARFAFAVILSRQPDGREFGIGLAQENDPGYWPQPGFGSFPTWSEASDKARRLNTTQGLTDAEAAQIVASSMRKTTKPKARR